jgi:mRNA-degrading endonuclease RelE of RelBE toxin-antitoxin system
MAFEIILAPEAVRDLEKLRANLRAEVRDAIKRHLRERPTKISKARIKRLRGVSRPQFRLRVRDVRVFYDVVATEVHVLAIVSKEQAEDWLRKVGSVK